MGVENPHVGVKFSKALQNCYKYVANTLLACLYSVSMSGVLMLKTVINREKHLRIVPTLQLVLQRVSNIFVIRL